MKWLMPHQKISNILDYSIYLLSATAWYFNEVIHYINELAGFFMFVIALLTFLFNESRKQRLQKILEAKIEEEAHDIEVLKIVLKDYTKNP